MVACAWFPQWTPDGRTAPDMHAVKTFWGTQDSQPHWVRSSWWSQPRTWTSTLFLGRCFESIVNSKGQCQFPHLPEEVPKRFPGLVPCIFPVSISSTEWRMCEECREHKLAVTAPWSCFYVWKQLIWLMLLQQGNAWTYACHIRIFLQANRNE